MRAVKRLEFSRWVTIGKPSLSPPAAISAPALAMHPQQRKPASGLHRGRGEGAPYNQDSQTSRLDLAAGLDPDRGKQDWASTGLVIMEGQPNIAARPSESGSTSVPPHVANVRLQLCRNRGGRVYCGDISIVEDLSVYWWK
jgi:hypothetical protein